MDDLPRDPRPDATLALLGDPYRLIPRTARRLGRPAYRTRMLLERATCLTGPEGARLFYDSSRFRREGAIPARVKNVLFGEGGVQGLDGAAHRDRKAMFLQVMTGAAVDRYEARLREAGAALLPRLAAGGDADLLHASAQVLMRASFDWAGAPLADDELETRTTQMVDAVGNAGRIGPPYWRGALARRRLDRWVAGIVEDVRAGRVAPPEGSPASVIAHWRDHEGLRLPAEVAAVELINATRPAVAICWYVVHLAHALHARPEAGAAVARDPTYRHGFVQEVRRLYPFAPMLAARAARPFAWRGHRFAEGELALLDLYGTSRDARAWPDPVAFRPERHFGREPGPFAMIPQGGGNHATGHRCPGEWITIRAMEVWAGWLAAGLEWGLEGEAALDMSSFPAVPEGRFVLHGVAPGGPESVASRY